LLELWENMRIIAGWLALVLALFTGIVVWRVRGLLNWNRSQQKELAELRTMREGADDVRRQALDQIIACCDALRHSTSLDMSTVTHLPAYWRTIAACYYPEESRPELCLTIGHLLEVARQLADRLEALLRRPGFEHIGKLRVRQVRRTYHWYQRFSASPTIAWILARWQTFRTFRHALRFLLPDPFIWIAYLSQRLTVMMAVRCLLIDLFVFTGKCALEAYDSQSEVSPTELENGNTDRVLDAYENELEKESPVLSPDLAELRSDLTGLPGRLWRPPGLDEWWQAVEKAASMIAAGHFPEASEPLDEATCRVLLDRGRYWLQAMSDARRMPVVRPLYQITLKRLQQIKTVTESDIVRTTGKMAGGAWSLWRWARWPIKVFRWVRRRSPAGVAVEMGSTLAVKATHNYLARYGFDRACRELDMVYRLSVDSHNSRVSNSSNSIGI
jgi:hypothetical protein